jgi:DNA-binding transcriptional MerR regulator
MNVRGDLMYKIKEVSTIAGISVRTLHHYDHIGLLTPTIVEDNGYRKYSEDDIDKLQQILFFKELGISLKEIKDILYHPNFDNMHALKMHKKLLLEKKNRLEQIIRSVDNTIQSMNGGSKMDKKDMFKPFDMTKIEEQQKKYAEETKEKYGQTDAYKQSVKKTSQYGEADWKRIYEQGNKNYERMVKAMHLGPEDEKVQDIVADMRQHISDNFYDCTIEIFRGLGDLYVNDPRFTKNIDKHKQGLSQFLKEAFHYYCDRKEKH